MSLDLLLQKAQDLPTYLISLGVIDGISEVERDEEKDNKKKKGVNNAQLMYIHELGSPINKIPPRPILAKTIKWAEENLLDKTINKALDGFFATNGNKKAIEKEVKRMGVRMQSYAQESIRSGEADLTPNAPATIRRKKSDLPLHDTGLLSRNIVALVTEEN